MIIYNLSGQTNVSVRVTTTQSDAEGRYEFSHIIGSVTILPRPGTFSGNRFFQRMLVSSQQTLRQMRSNNYVRPIIKMDAAPDGGRVSVLGIRFQRGGWISGRVERPAELESNAIAMVKLEIQGTVPTNSFDGGSYDGVNGTFRSYPLPPGTYTLHAEWNRMDRSIPASGIVGGLFNT
jgi:hypothetical protein